MNLWNRHTHAAWFVDFSRPAVGEIYVGRMCGHNRINWNRVQIPHGGTVPEYSTDPIIRHFDQETPQMRECGMRGAP